MALLFRRRNDRWTAVSVVCLALAFACEPNLIVGKWTSESGAEAGIGGEAGAAAGAGAEAGSGAGASSTCDGAGGEGAVQREDPVALPWSTGFEDAFCGYTAVAGYCYQNGRASHDIVSSPVHSGTSAAAFSIVANGTFDDNQTRCLRQGVLPDAAYYSAYFFIPSAPTAATNWNLMHFRGGDPAPGAVLDGLWDVSLARQADGTYQVSVYDFLRKQQRAATNAPPVPIGAWFQLEVYLKRAAGATGTFEVRQDGKLVFSLIGVSTDNTAFGQWFVGNLALSLTPPESVLYVDDVAIRETQ